MRSGLSLTILFVSCVFVASCTLLLPSQTVRYVKYTVAPRDTLYSIGKRFGVTAEELERMNRIDNPRQLAVGAVLKVPYHEQGKPGSGRVIASEGSRSKSQSREIKGNAKQYVSRMLWPVAGGKLVSVFGRRWLSFHEGIDISAPQGTDVYAAHAGIVVYSGDKLRGYGNLVVIRGDGVLSVYAHNRSNLVRVGEQVSRGERIARVGATGKASGPHLHFEVRVMNKQGKYEAVDPMTFINKVQR